MQGLFRHKEVTDTRAVTAHHSIELYRISTQNHTTRHHRPTAPAGRALAATRGAFSSRRTAAADMEPTGNLTSLRCDAFLRDSSHIFRHMWAAEGWGSMGGQRPACWDVVRNGTSLQSSETFFTSTQRGKYCRSDWYEGQLAMPNFTAVAPALLGFDDDNEPYCAIPVEQQRANWKTDQLRCYAARYPDLRRRYCVDGMAASCNWDALQTHYDDEGHLSRCKRTGVARCCTRPHRASKLV